MVEVKVRNWKLPKEFPASGIHDKRVNG